VSTKILIVEDDELVQASLLAILESEGYENFQAFDGMRAKKLIERELFNLILLDVNLPDISGLELCKGFKQTEPRTRIILLIGYSNENLDSEAINNYVDECVIKPYDIDILLKIISKNLEEQRKESKI
jgi:DNA-binding response OmpR family regulator